jgi:thiosulfate reductase cytochrome b subunit
MEAKRVQVYPLFIRLWHWSQALIIFMLMFTGFTVHGSLNLITFDTAVKIHNAAGLLLIGEAFAMFFYYITTGRWKQYKSLFDVDGMIKQARYYAYGIVRGEPHPIHPTEISHLNPLQKITYLVFKAALLPIMGITGTMYLYREYLEENLYSRLGIKLFVIGNVAMWHTIVAFALLAFIIVHVYMTTTGKTIFSHVHVMATGWEEKEEHASD